MKDWLRRTLLLSGLSSHTAFCITDAFIESRCAEELEIWKGLLALKAGTEYPSKTIFLIDSHMKHVASVFEFLMSDPLFQDALEEIAPIREFAPKLSQHVKILFKQPKVAPALIREND